VLDPTCGSGTTAYVAEQWGRRWITIDTSRVALAIARQRLLTAKYDYYALKDELKGIAGGSVYKTVPHVTLKSIAQNTNLDPIFARHEPILDEQLAALNQALLSVTDDVRQKLAVKLLGKQKAEGKRSIADADRRRWELPNKGEKFEHWTAPFDTDADHPPKLREAITAYRKAWRAKMDGVNVRIAANAEQEELVDQPKVKKGVVRVSGPFTVEAEQPPEISFGNEVAGGSPSGGVSEELEETFGLNGDGETEIRNAEAYLDQMLRMLRIDGVRFLGNKSMRFTRLEALNG
jgi:adenine-specific DNA-methyltransferase